MRLNGSHARVTVIIPNWNTRRWLPGCLDGLRAQSYEDFHVILVDNGSTDDSISFVQRYYPEVQVIGLAENRGFAVAVNTGIRGATSKYVALLNVDTIPQPQWLANLVETIEECPPDIGCLASKMLNLENPKIIDDAGDSFSWYGSSWKRGKGEAAEIYCHQEEIFSACAGAALYRRTFLEDVGLFDESFNSYLEDVDLGLRGQLLGYRCLYLPDAVVLHAGQGAKIPRPRYVRLTTRNRLTLLLKNIPLSLLVKHGYTIVFGQVYFFLVYKKPLHSLKGYFAFIRDLPQTVKQRRAIQKRKKVSNQVLDTLLTCDLGEPPLREVVTTKVKARFSVNK